MPKNWFYQPPTLNREPSNPEPTLLPHTAKVLQHLQHIPKNGMVQSRVAASSAAWGWQSSESSATIPKSFGFEAATRYGASNQCYPEYDLFEPCPNFQWMCPKKRAGVRGEQKSVLMSVNPCLIQLVFDLFSQFSVPWCLCGYEPVMQNKAIFKTKNCRPFYPAERQNPACRPKTAQNGCAWRSNLISWC